MLRTMSLQVNAGGLTYFSTIFPRSRHLIRTLVTGLLALSDELGIRHRRTKVSMAALYPKLEFDC